MASKVMGSHDLRGVFVLSGFVYLFRVFFFGFLCILFVYLEVYLCFPLVVGLEFLCILYT
jgi:hypothetical protein